MRRRLLNLVTALSLLLCVAVVGLWVRSWFATDFVGWCGEGRWYGALSTAGLLRLERGGYDEDPKGWTYAAQPAWPDGVWHEARSAGTPLGRYGFAYRTVDYDYDGRRIRRSAYLPHWVVVLVTGIISAVSLRHTLVGRRRRHRRQRGLCPSCGYDLTGNVSGVCPECGQAA